MKIYKTTEEFMVDVKDNKFVLDDNIVLRASLYVPNISITAWDIDAWDIDARDINARNINAWNINARNINAWNIKARDINARNIKARDISYFEYCVANSIMCRSISSRIDKSQLPVCLDGVLKIDPDSESNPNGAPLPEDNKVGREYEQMKKRKGD